MQRISWNESKRLLASMAFVGMSLGVPAIAAPKMSQPMTAQATASSLIGQCRAVNKSTPIYKAAASTSAVVRTLGANTKVTLANEGAGGFIAISEPVQGFVQTANLKLCPGTSNPTPAPAPSPSPSPAPAPSPSPSTGGTPSTGSTCRRVVQPLGLVIRSDASTTSAVAGGVAVNESVDLSTNPPTTKVDADGRIWVQISKPASGWISNGFKTGGGSNLIYCP